MPPAIEVFKDAMRDVLTEKETRAMFGRFPKDQRIKRDPILKAGMVVIPVPTASGTNRQQYQSLRHGDGKPTRGRAGYTDTTACTYIIQVRLPGGTTTSSEIFVS
jgi:hypothetical protein